jgi:hypothetical protein
MTFTFVDDDGAKSTTTLYIDPNWAVDLTDLSTIAQEIATALEALSDAKLLSCVISMEGYDNVGELGATGSDVEDKGVFLMRTDDNFGASISVPSILETKLVDTGVTAGIQIDFTDDDVIAFKDILEDGGEVGVGELWEVVDSRGQDIAAVVDGYKQNRASFKSRGRRG